MYKSSVHSVSPTSTSMPFPPEDTFWKNLTISFLEVPPTRLFTPSISDTTDSAIVATTSCDIFTFPNSFILVPPNFYFLSNSNQIICII